MVSRIGKVFVGVLLMMGRAGISAGEARGGKIGWLVRRTAGF